MKKISFVLQKFVKRAENIIFSVVFVCARFTGISHFLDFPSNENVRKQHLSENAFSTRSLDAKMKCRIVMKTSDFVDNV